MLFSVDTTVRGRFSEKRCGPSRRCARNASAALENFVCCPQKTFSTASVKLRNTHHEQMSSALPPRTDIDLARRFGSNVSRIQCCGSVEVRLAALRRVNGARIISPRPIVLVCRKPYDNLRSD